MKVATTSISSKGQVVIPLAVRKALKLSDGDALAVQAKDDVIVLRKVYDMSPEERRTLAILDKAWKEIEDGKGHHYNSAEEFLEDLRQWSASRPPKLSAKPSQKQTRK